MKFIHFPWNNLDVTIFFWKSYFQFLKNVYFLPTNFHATFLFRKISFFQITVFCRLQEILLGNFLQKSLFSKCKEFSFLKLISRNFFVLEELIHHNFKIFRILEVVLTERFSSGKVRFSLKKNFRKWVILVGNGSFRGFYFEKTTIKWKLENSNFQEEKRTVEISSRKRLDVNNDFGKWSFLVENGSFKRF